LIVIDQFAYRLRFSVCYGH